MSLVGKVGLVTGASGEIGAAIARGLAASGATIIGTYAEAAPPIPAASSGVGHWIPLDQRLPQSIDGVVESIVSDHGRLDILINNAAWNVTIPFTDLDGVTPDIWDRVIETNMRGPFLLSRACAPLLRAHGTGRIVNISSVAGIAPIGSSVAYAVGKAGINHLTRCLAVAMAPAVSVNCIAPGLVENTGMSNRALDSAAQLALRDNCLLQRSADLADIVAQVIIFVTSASITGQTVAIDGGMPVAMR